MPLSDEPAKNLVRGLMSLPSTASKTPTENQLTEVLAWLLEKSPILARRFVALAVGDLLTIQNCGWLHSDLGTEDGGTFRGVRVWTQRSVPSLPGDPAPCYYPDLWITGGEARKFLLVVEVKVDATFHEMILNADAAMSGLPTPPLLGPQADGAIHLLQPDAYLFALAQARPEFDDVLLTTLSRHADVPIAYSRVGAVDRLPNLSWRAVIADFDAARPSVEPGVALVLDDYLDALRAIVQPPSVKPPVGAGLPEEFAAVAYQVIDALRSDLHWLPAEAQVGWVTSPQGAGYVGFHIKAPGASHVSVIDVHLRITYPGAKYSFPEATATSVDLVITKAENVGLPTDAFPSWRFGKDTAGYAAYYQHLPLGPDGSDVAIQVATHLAGLSVAAAGWPVA